MLEKYKIPQPDMSVISVERKEFLRENLPKIFWKNDLWKYLEEEYLPWEKIKYQPLGDDFEKPEELWYILSLVRYGRKSPIQTEDWDFFWYVKWEFLEKLLHELDLSLWGTLLWVDLTHEERKIYLQTGVAEEAISSAQIEWAMTDSKVAKNMLLKKQKPKTTDEKMIVNNYRIMTYIKDEMKNENLSLDALLYIQKELTKWTMEEKDYGGRFRRDSDEIVVRENNFILHNPPSEKFLKKALEQMIEYANDKNDSGFVHPFIKATILHFWIAYLHPFCDGNWRTARAIFYWYLLKKWYWGMSYIPISQTIKNSKKQYRDAYLYSEQHNHDITYFLVYIAKKTELAFKDFKKFIAKKREKQKNIYENLQQFGYNDRQNKLLTYFLKNPDSYTNAITHQNYYSISKATALKDLTILLEKWLVYKQKRWLYMNYYPVENLKELLE